MARIRTVKPEFWDSPGIETIDPMWRLLYIAMWNWADDTGRGKAEARELMGFAFPRDEDMTLGEFRRGLGEVRRVFGVNFYRVDGRSYYSIPSWEKHQKIDKRSSSRWPAPEDGEPYDPTVKPQVRPPLGGHSEEPAENPPNPRRESGAGTGEQRNRGTGEQIFSSEVASDPDQQPRPDIEDLLDLLDHEIAANGNRPPKRNKTNHDAMRLLLDRDGYTHDQIAWIIRWCQQDNFWQANILSAAKLREKFAQLVAKSRTSHRSQKEDNNLAILHQFVNDDPPPYQELTS
ncbi:hypothetical protein [Brevibacterium otitidis]|uniref:Uncharacterized protein n=1 Tax=Brevibacterium otitidis TaxID=53364 RepID=A0ABV5X118_9MICO|nr:hypothetical protein GCM10023233_04650 [Brevibacterium otitidis]